MKPRPRTSTLFPYTTLFRSKVRASVRSRRPSGRRMEEKDHEQTQISHGQRGGCGIDRKSTRLNSSHTVISYAVFCLKKKTSGTIRLDREDITRVSTQELARR